MVITLFHEILEVAASKMYRDAAGTVLTFRPEMKSLATSGWPQINRVNYVSIWDHIQSGVLGVENVDVIRTVIALVVSE